MKKRGLSKFLAISSGVIILVIAVAFLLYNNSSETLSKNELGSESANGNESNIIETNKTKDESPEKVPSEIISSAKSYIGDVLPNNILEYSSYIGAEYSFTGVEVELTDSEERSYYRNKVDYVGGSITQCFDDEEYERVCVSIYRNGKETVSYKVPKKVYWVEYLLAFPSDYNQEDIKIKFYVIEGGQIYSSYYNTLNECEENSLKCPPFKISKANATETMSAMITPKEQYVLGEPVLIYYRNSEGFSGYIWQGSYCPLKGPPEGSGPVPLGSSCQTFKIDAYDGSEVFGR